MRFAEVELPSNRRFGLFFACVFGLLAVYFYFNHAIFLFSTNVILSISFAVATVFKPIILLPFNKLWMRLGLLLGMIINPIVLGLIFFGLFMPLGLILRIFGRDELRLKVRNNVSHWIHRSENNLNTTSHKNQF